MYILASIAGLTIAVIVWFLASHLIETSIEWVEDHRPELAGSKRLRVGEAIVCGALVLASFALAFWLTRLLWLQMK